MFIGISDSNLLRGVWYGDAKLSISSGSWPFAFVFIILVIILIHYHLKIIIGIGRYLSHRQAEHSTEAGPFFLQSLILWDPIHPPDNHRHLTISLKIDG